MIGKNIGQLVTNTMRRHRGTRRRCIRGYGSKLEHDRPFGMVGHKLPFGC